VVPAARIEPATPKKNNMSKSEENISDKDTKEVSAPLRQNAPLTTNPIPVSVVKPTQEHTTEAATEDKVFERLSLLYQENAKVAAIFWEWRNKVINYFAVSIAALTTLAGWLYPQKLGRPISVPLFIGAILSIILTYLDERNAEILKATYKCGRDIETALLKTKDEDSLIKTGNTIFKLIGEAHPSDQASYDVEPVRRGITYTKVLRVTLTLISVLLGGLGAANLIWPNLL
jgi:hypothetical protein